MAYADFASREPSLADQIIDFFQGPKPGASVEELYRAGLAHSTGQGAPVDFVAAHKWFNLAALAGHAEARNQRREIAGFLSPEEVAKALRQAREWIGN